MSWLVTKHIGRMLEQCSMKLIRLQLIFFLNLRLLNPSHQNLVSVKQNWSKLAARLAPAAKIQMRALPSLKAVSNVTKCETS